MRIYLFLIFFISTVAIPQPLVETKYSYYSVSSQSKHELLDSLNRATPIREDGNLFHGRTDWDIRWNFWWETKNNYCRITKVKVTVDITYTMPRLENSSNEVKAIWDRWYPRLLFHEKNHKNNALTIANRIENGIYQLPEHRDCKVLEKSANRLGDNLIEKLKQIDVAYDRKTNHGETEGAWIYSHL